MKRAVLVVLSVMVWAAVVACSADQTAAHAIVGEWGARTQSGELVAAFRFEDDGTFAVIDPSGTGLDTTSGTFVELDETSVRTSQGIGPDGSSVTFTIVDDELSVDAGAGRIGGFERIAGE